jgi:hypothetical protein
MIRKNLPQVRPVKVRAAFEQDLAACWRRSQALHPDHSPYAFVLQGLEGTPYFHPHVLTEEGLTQVSQQYVANGLHETVEEGRKELRYSVGDSPFAAELEQGLPTVNSLLQPREPALDEESDYSLLAKAAMEAFETLDKEGIFGNCKWR